MTDIALVPYILATAIAFVIGGFIYSGAALEKQFLAASNITKEQVEKNLKHKMMYAVIMRLIQVHVLVFTIHMNAALFSAGVPTYGGAFQVAFWLWLGFIAVTTASENIWKEDINWKLMGIHSFAGFVMIVAAALLYVLFYGWLA